MIDHTAKNDMPISLNPGMPKQTTSAKFTPDKPTCLGCGEPAHVMNPMAGYLCADCNREYMKDLSTHH